MNKPTDMCIILSNIHPWWSAGQHVALQPSFSHQPRRIGHWTVADVGHTAPVGQIEKEKRW